MSAATTARSGLVTGAAGFIGSNLVERLLTDGHRVVGLDNFATGFQRNLDDVRERVGEAAWARFRFVRGDIRDLDACTDAVRGCDFVLHHAALGSVPRSIARPLDTFSTNVDGFVKVLDAARTAGVSRFVYASSSSVYGDHPDLPKVEERTGRPLSPYASSKAADEIVAQGFVAAYGMSVVGLRYFNVFGRRQDPDGAYAAVIPRWVKALISGEAVHINGDGQTSRDFCYIENAVQANLRAALAPALPAGHHVLNIAVGQRTTLLALFEMLRALLQQRGVDCARAQPQMREFRPGDVRHSLASIDKARALLGYAPTHEVGQGLAETVDWYLANV